MVACLLGAVHVLAWTQAASASLSISPLDPHIQVIGRYQPSSGTAPAVQMQRTEVVGSISFDHPGVEVIFTVGGSSWVTATLSQVSNAAYEHYFLIFIDGVRCV